MQSDVTEKKIEVPKTTSEREWATRFIVVASFLILGAIYLFNATNNILDDDIPTDLITGVIGTVVGYYFLRTNKSK